MVCASREFAPIVSEHPVAEDCIESFSEPASLPFATRIRTSETETKRIILLVEQFTS
jgi:hypothetical protein